MYTHDGPNLYLTADDQVVEEGDTRAATLLVATGCQLAPDIAAKYGLPRLGAPADETEAHEIAPRDLGKGELPEEAELPADSKAKPVTPNKAKHAPGNKGG